MQLINLNKLGEHFTIGIKGGIILGLAFNGQVYGGWYTPVHKGDKIDCGLNYDPISGNTELIAPKTLFEFATPGYYYTDTDFLRSIGFAPLVDNIIGSTRNVQALIRSRDNYTKYTYGQLFNVWYLLLQTQTNYSVSTSGLFNLYKSIIDNGNSTYIIPQSKLKQLTFYDGQHNVVRDVTDSTTSLYKDVVSCSILDKSNNKEYPVEAYLRSGISYDIYIGSYHIVVYSKVSGDYFYFYTRDSNEDSTSLSHAFWEIGNWAPLISMDNTSATSWVPTANLTKLGYSFSSDINGCGLDTELGIGSLTDNCILLAYGENSLQNTVITDTTQNTRTTWFNADPNIYTKIGKLPDDTIGVLPKGADMNNVGAGSDKESGNSLYTGTSIEEMTNATADKLLFPLGTYYLDPNAKYSDYKNFPTTSDTSSGTPISITAYTLDGMTVMQEAVWRGFATYRRAGYQSGLGTTSWTGWSQRKWN